MHVKIVGSLVERNEGEVDHEYLDVNVNRSNDHGHVDTTSVHLWGPHLEDWSKSLKTETFKGDATMTGGGGLSVLLVGFCFYEECLVSQKFLFDSLEPFPSTYPGQLGNAQKRNKPKQRIYKSWYGLSNLFFI